MTLRECRTWIRQARSTLRLAERKMPGDSNYARAKAALDYAERLLAIGALDAAYGRLTEASNILTAVGERAIEAMRPKPKGQ